MTMQELASFDPHPLVNNVLPLPRSISGRRIAKSNIQISITREYSVTSFLLFNPLDPSENSKLPRLSSTQIPFEFKQETNSIKPQIRQRIETLQQAVYRTQSLFQR